MKIVSIGGGPAGLYFALLRKKLHPEDSITVFERNQPGETFGWGVVFSEATLGHFRDRDAPSYASIERSFAHWDDIETHFAGTVTRSTGHGFCGLSRRALLLILEARARELGVELRHGVEVDSELPYAEADLILLADGVQSKLRERHAAHFQPSFDWRKCRFTWLGTTRPLDAFTFHFKENEHGLFQVHAYPFEKGTSTWIVECREEVWRRAGLDRADEAATVEYCERLFAPELAGHRLLSNRSLWRQFPTIRCQRWAKHNMVLLGDAAHTAHFSIGSGTKLAMEDSIALIDAFERHPGRAVPEVLEDYERARMGDVQRIQHAAQTSLEWFENSGRYLAQAPALFNFNLMTRSKRITYDNLKLRDPALVAQVDAHFAARTPARAGARPAPPAFTPFALRSLELDNRIAVSPMCQYSADFGTIGDWHLVHLGSRAIGGAGLVIGEATAVSPDGRISHGCSGIWLPEHARAWKRVVDFARAHSGAKLGLQLAHAGRKASCSRPWEGDAPLVEDAWATIGPSALPFAERWHKPREMQRDDMQRVIADFVRAAGFALEAGFDLIELHCAHGYLLSSFLSPLANQRTDEYGGSLERRMRFPLELFEAVRAAWPAEKPLAVRVSADDWLGPRGQTIEDTIAFARELKARGCDLVDVSSAGNSPESKPVYGRMYQVPFAEAIRYGAGIATMAVGGISDADQANTVIGAERADLVAIARAHLADPYLAMHAAVKYELELPRWPVQYASVKPRPARPARA